jgi:hypothetical protein
MSSKGRISISDHQHSPVADNDRAELPDPRPNEDRTLRRGSLRWLGIAAGLLAIVAAVSVLADQAMGLEIIDPNAFHPNPAEEPSTAINTIQHNLTIDTETLKNEDDQLFQDTTDSTEQDRKDLDWCMWWALGDMAQEVAKGQTNIESTLEERIEQCLSNYFASMAEASSIGWVAKAMTLRDNIQLLETLGENTNEATSNVMNGAKIELSQSEWETWFNEDASSVPAA